MKNIMIGDTHPCTGNHNGIAYCQPGMGGLMRAFFGVVMVLVAEHRAFQALIREGKATSPMKYNALKANGATNTVEGFDKDSTEEASLLFGAAAIGKRVDGANDFPADGKKPMQAPARKSKERAMERL